MADTHSIADRMRAGDTEGVRSAVSDAADQARQKAQDLGRQAQDLGRQAKERVEKSRSGAADLMDSTADTIRQTGVAPAGRMAEGMHSAADYVRNNDLGTMMSDLGSAIKNNPVPSLITAVALGFVIGAMIRRD